MDDLPAYVCSVLKRNGTMEVFLKEKLLARILIVMDHRKIPSERMSMAENLVEKVIQKVGDPVESKDIDLLLAETAAELEPIDLSYGSVAAAVQLDTIYRKTQERFSVVMSLAAHLLDDDFLHLVSVHADALDALVDEARDGFLGYVSLRTLERTYLLKDGDQLFERPQHMFMRVALAIHQSDFPSVKTSYDLLSSLRYTHASPTLFNAGTVNFQLSSCFLLPAEEDPDLIFTTLEKAARISRGGGGLGIGFNRVPGKGSVIEGVERSGISPILKLFNAAVDVVDQGVEKRPGAMSAYLEVWHPDVFDFIRMKTVKRAGEDGARKLFYALWVPDLFMKRVETNKDWTLFCPTDAPELVDAIGEDFTAKYEDREKQGCGTRKFPARELWKAILEGAIESGGPSILFKDAINRKSNESHLGTITQSNLCTEIVQFANHNETAVCNLASIILPAFVNADRTFNFAFMGDVVRHVVLSLNRVVHGTAYPTVTSKTSAKAHRALGIGIQGLADTFALMGMAFDSDEALELSTEIAEALYFNALDESCNLIRFFGAHLSFPESPMASGRLQFDLWNNACFSGRFDWTALRKKVRKGVANSQLIAYMPTAATSLISGVNECFEPFSSLFFSRKVLAGQFTITPRLLVEKLRALGIWNESLRNQIVANGGSIQSIQAIPLEIRRLFKTAWDVDPSVLVRMAAARGPFVCQSQSLSLYLASPSLVALSQALFEGWRLGLKTGMYYLRTKPAARPTPITLPVGYWNRERGCPTPPDCLSCSA